MYVFFRLQDLTRYSGRFLFQIRPCQKQGKGCARCVYLQQSVKQIERERPRAHRADSYRKPIKVRNGRSCKTKRAALHRLDITSLDYIRPATDITFQPATLLRSTPRYLKTHIQSPPHYNYTTYCVSSLVIRDTKCHCLSLLLLPVGRYYMSGCVPIAQILLLCHVWGSFPTYKRIPYNKEIGRKFVETLLGMTL